MSDTVKWLDLSGLDGPRTLAAASRILPGWASLILSLLLGWQLARIGWDLVPGPAAGNPVAIPPSIAAPAAADLGFIAETIAAAHLFGEAGEQDAGERLAPVPIPDVLEDLEATRQNLQLKGIVAASDPELSAAIIEDPARNEKTYQIGEAISAGVSLHAVFPRRVVLNENGRFTNLVLPAEFAIPQAPVGHALPQRPASAPSIQSVVAQNVSRLADVIRPTPYFINGQQQGYRVYPGRDRRQFTALGLRPGDLVKDIDGQALTDPAQAMKIFQELGTASEVSVTIERDGRPQSVILKTSQLDLSDEDPQ